MSNERPEILLKTDTKTITLELGCEGKFSAKARGCGARGVDGASRSKSAWRMGAGARKVTAALNCYPGFSGLAGRV